MRMEQLQYLVDVAETKSMSKTAERLFVTPQAISKNLKQLELELDEALLVRTSMGVELTRIGASVVALARDMLEKESQMKQLILANKKRMEQTQSFSIKICSTSSIVNMILPAIIAEFMQMGIHIVPRIYMVDTLQELLDHTEQGVCDLGLLTYNEDALFNKFTSYQYSLDMDFLGQDELVVTMKRTEPWAEKGTISRQDFYQHLCSMFCMMPVDNIAQKAMDSHVMCSNDADFHRSMIKEANAYVVMPRRAYQHFFADEQYAAVPMENAQHTILHAAIYRKDAPENLHIFAKYVRNGMQEQ